jgi:hypothetical protein
MALSRNHLIANMHLEACNLNPTLLPPSPNLHRNINCTDLDIIVSMAVPTWLLHLRHHLCNKVTAKAQHTKATSSLILAKNNDTAKVPMIERDGWTTRFIIGVWKSKDEWKNPGVKILLGVVRLVLEFTSVVF